MEFSRIETFSQPLAVGMNSALKAQELKCKVNYFKNKIITSKKAAK